MLQLVFQKPLFMNVISYQPGGTCTHSKWIQQMSPCPTTLLPPKHRVPIGRTKKKRWKSASEKEDMIKGNTVSRAQKTVTCTKCNNKGHNVRTFKRQLPTVGGASGKKKGKEKKEKGKENEK
uniref:Uncharacterized protein n=1 Tax=Lactuca sativa TaxID=4236 RepID=A0A9R1X6I2_LACSA|nr:hypothetical protein LSAT_V11C500271100 [Lactuca sativa]